MAQPVLKIDAGDGAWQATKIAGRSAHERGQLPKRPMGGRDRIGLSWQDEPQALRVVPRRLDPHLPALQRPGTRAIGLCLHGAVHVV